jgi:CelD/BcsL family acetyltransferase involved in cellulose biosynthesis
VRPGPVALSARSAIAVEVRTDLDGVRARWDDLVLYQPLPSPFLRSWWLEAHPATYVLALDGDRLVGGLALGRSRRLGVTRYTAPGPAVLCPDHLDLLAEPGRTQEVIDAVAGWFDTQRSWQLDVRGLVADPLLARVVGRPAAPDELAPWQPLGDDFLADRSSSFRRSVRRSRKRLAQTALTARRTDDATSAFEALRALHEARGDRGPLLETLGVVERAVREGVARGEARVDVLDDGETVAAVTVGFTTAGRLSLYQVARSLRAEHDGAGTVLLAHVIEDAGCTEVDLLRGDEPYKGSFADRTRTLTRLRAARGLLPCTLLALEDAARAARRRLSARRSARA